jgi:hypothetical protein
MLGVKFLILEIGCLLVYAAIKGKSVGSLIRGDSTTKSTNTSIASAP